MKVLVAVILIFSISSVVMAQDALGLIRRADGLSYSPRNKALTDLVVDITSPELTEQINDQKVLGKINEVVFRVYWTINPERLAIEIIGLPEGFREIKEELKAAMLPRFEYILPLSLEKRFQGYTFKTTSGKSDSVAAVDPTNLRPIPEFEFVFDGSGKVTTIIGKKPVGLMTTKMTWAKASWSEPAEYIEKSVTQSDEGPQSATVESKITWVTQAGIGLPSEIETTTVQQLRQPAPAAPLVRKTQETIRFKNYKVNVGEAMKWFIGPTSTKP